MLLIMCDQLVPFLTGAYGDPVAPTLLDLAGVPESDRLPLPGSTLLGEAEQTVFSEYHVEKVRAPCFMARRGCHKLIYGHDRRLFDLEDDPGEWTDLSGGPETRQVEERLLAEIVERFDPERIAADGAASVRRCEIVRDANARNGTRWDHTPDFDGRRRYVR
ncbi:MAG TPA: hypothetical protein VF186_09560 [Gaiellaceae bacterium]